MSRRGFATSVAAVLALATPEATGEPRLTPFSAGPTGALPAPWRVVTLPKIPRHTRYVVADDDGRRAVRAEADASYANVIHRVDVDVAQAPILRFAWRVDRFPSGSDLATKAGDDLAAKVCVLLDLPLERLAFLDRARIRLARSLFDPHLPPATLCYVWDRILPKGQWLPNAYTDRVRMLVLRSGAQGEHNRWFEERRDLRDDFRAAFPAEAAGGLPKVSAVAFATDADNTGSRASAWFGDVELGSE